MATSMSPLICTVESNKAVYLPQLSLGSSLLSSWGNTFATTQEGIYLWTRSDGSLFNLAHLKARTKVHEALIRDMLVADDATVMTHTQRELQLLMDHFSQACKDFRLIISLMKTNILGQDIPAPPVITIDDYELEVIHQFTYLGSTITDNLSLDPEIKKRIRKAASTLACLTSRVWTNPKLTIKTKMAVYNACVLSTLLYGSEPWTTYAHQEKRLNTFHLRSLWCILGISWQDKVTNTDVLSCADLPTKYTLLRQCWLHWLGHVCHMEDGQIPKDILYVVLTSWAEKHWLPTAEVQGCMQERHEGTQHQHQFLGGPHHWPHQLEKHASQTAAGWWKEADSSSSREARPQKGNSSQQTRVNAQMRPMQPRLSLSHWSLQPQEVLLKSSRQPGQVMDGLSSSIVSHDWWRPTRSDKPESKALEIPSGLLMKAQHLPGTWLQAGR